MKGVAAADKKQSEAFVCTAALFHIFSNSPKDGKVNLRLPPAWKDLWYEMAEAKKNHLDAQDRESVRSLRTMVRQRQDQELEDGVIAFRGRGAVKPSLDPAENGALDRSKLNAANAEALRAVWAEKSSTNKFQLMLVSDCYLQSTVCQLKGHRGSANSRPEISHAAPHVAVPTPSSESRGGKSGCDCVRRNRMVRTVLFFF